MKTLKDLDSLSSEITRAIVYYFRVADALVKFVLKMNDESLSNGFRKHLLWK